MQLLGTTIAKNATCRHTPMA